MRKGFTLIELLFVLVVIGVIGTLGYQKMMEVSKKANAEKLAGDLKILEVALQRYYKDLGTYPVNLKWLVQKPDAVNGDAGFDAVSLAAGQAEDGEILEYWSGPYLTSLKLSPDKPECVAATAVRFVCATASIASEDAFDSSIHVKGNPQLPIAADGSPTQSAMQSGSDTGVYYNVLTIVGLDMGVAKNLAQTVNGRNPDSNGTLISVAKENVTYKIGTPSASNYPTFNQVIYRYASPF